MACGFKSHPGYKRILLNEMQNPFFFSYTKVSSGNCAPKEAFFCCCRCGVLSPYLFWRLVAASFEGCLFFVCSSIVFRFVNEEESKNKRRRIEEETSPHQARPELGARLVAMEGTPIPIPKASAIGQWPKGTFFSCHIKNNSYFCSRKQEKTWRVSELISRFPRVPFTARSTWVPNSENSPVGLVAWYTLFTKTKYTLSVFGATVRIVPNYFRS